MALVRVRTGIKNRVHAMLAKLNIDNPYSDLFGKAGVGHLKNLDLSPPYRDSLDGYLAIINVLNVEIAKAERVVEATFEDSADAQLLSTIPGVGPLLALTIAAEIDDVGRYPSSKHLASSSGLVPSTSQSGNHSYHGNITRQGSAWLRWALVEAAIHTVRYPGPVKDYYLKLAKRKGKKIARVAAARKLSTYVYHMLKERKDYRHIIEFLKSDLG